MLLFSRHQSSTFVLQRPAVGHPVHIPFGGSRQLFVLELLVHRFTPSTSSVVVAFLSSFLLWGFSGCFPSCGRPSLSCLYSHLHCTCNNSKLCVDYRGSKYFLLIKMEPLGDALYTLFCYFGGSFYFVIQVHFLGTLLILNFAGKFLPVLW